MNRKLLIYLDKSFFRIVFYVIVIIGKLRRANKTNYHIKLEEAKSFLVIRPGGLGDGLMSIPFLKALRRAYPNNRICLVCVKKNNAAFMHLSFVDEIYVLDNLGSIHKILIDFIRNRFDVVFDLEPFRKISSIITYISRATVRIGFDTNPRRLLYTHFVTYHNEKSFESWNMVRQLKVLDIEVSKTDAADMSFPLHSEVYKKVGRVFRSHEIDPQNDFIVAVAPGVLKPYHRWMMPRFSKLIELILYENSNTKIILVGAAADLSDAREVLEHLKEHDKVKNFVGKTNFIEALGILKACKILIASDGGIVYMAAAMGCSTISLWGPGVMDRFKPPGPDHVGIRKDYFCIPCVNYSRLGEFPPCPYDRRCINDITPEDVFEKYVDLKRLKESKIEDNNEIMQFFIEES